MPSLSMHSTSKTRAKKSRSRKKRTSTTTPTPKSNMRQQHKINNTQPPNTINGHNGHNQHNGHNGHNRYDIHNGHNVHNGHNGHNVHNGYNGHNVSSLSSSLSSSSSSSSSSKQKDGDNRSSPPNHSTFMSSSPSSPCQQQTYSSKLTSSPSFLGNRSPFYETLSRHCVMPICQKQLINFQFNLPFHYVSDIKNSLKNKKEINNNIDIHRLLHIRLFDLSATKHVEWNPDLFILKINQKPVKMPPIIADKNKKKKLGKKWKGFRFVQPLDISKYAQPTMSFEIACHKVVFYGAASIEIVNLLSVDQIAARVIQRSDLAAKLHAICDNDKNVIQKCKICGIHDNLSRCSRCKATWYCSREHQEKDWNQHHLGCQPFDELNRLRLTNNNNKNNNNKKNEDIICDEIKVSIRDPLTLCRISVAVRGINCHHPQCVDLKTYLNYCHHTKIWQCPICMQPLIYTDLVVDQSMNKIIKEVSNDIDQVRLNPDDYSYKIITLKEMQESDNNYSNNNNKRRKKKRKINNNQNNNNIMTINNNKKKKRKINHITNNKKTSQIEVIVLD